MKKILVGKTDKAFSVVIVDEIKLDGFDEMTGYSIKNGIKIEWTFNNWDCIKWTYTQHNATDDIEIIKSWSNIVFEGLIKAFPEIE